VTEGNPATYFPTAWECADTAARAHPPGTDLAVAFTFHVYALDRPLRLAADASLDQAFDALNARSVAEGELSGGYDRRACSLVGLLDGDLASHIAGDEQPVAVERPVA
jgi:hypothetical protein